MSQHLTDEQVELLLASDELPSDLTERLKLSPDLLSEAARVLGFAKLCALLGAAEREAEATNEPVPEDAMERIFARVNPIYERHYARTVGHAAVSGTAAEAIYQNRHAATIRLIVGKLVGKAIELVEPVGAEVVSLLYLRQLEPVRGIARDEAPWQMRTDELNGIRVSRRSEFATLDLEIRPWPPEHFEIAITVRGPGELSGPIGECEIRCDHVDQVTLTERTNVRGEAFFKVGLGEYTFTCHCKEIGDLGVLAIAITE